MLNKGTKPTAACITSYYEQSPRTSVAVRGLKRFRKVGKQAGTGPVIMSYLFGVAG